MARLWDDSGVCVCVWLLHEKCKNPTYTAPVGTAFCHVSAYQEHCTVLLITQVRPCCGFRVLLFSARIAYSNNIGTTRSNQRTLSEIFRAFLGGVLGASSGLLPAGYRSARMRSNARHLRLRRDVARTVDRRPQRAWRTPYSPAHESIVFAQCLTGSFRLISERPAFSCRSLQDLSVC